MGNNTGAAVLGIAIIVVIFLLFWPRGGGNPAPLPSTLSTPPASVFTIFPSFTGFRGDQITITYPNGQAIPVASYGFSFNLSNRWNYGIANIRLRLNDPGHVFTAFPIVSDYAFNGLNVEPTFWFTDCVNHWTDSYIWVGRGNINVRNYAIPASSSFMFKASGGVGGFYYPPGGGLGGSYKWAQGYINDPVTGVQMFRANLLVKINSTALLGSHGLTWDMSFDPVIPVGSNITASRMTVSGIPWSVTVTSR